MLIMRRSALLTILASIGLLGFGIFFMMRGCLSRFDERFAHGPVLLMENDGQRVILALVEFQEAIQYSRTGGMVRKSVRTSYYLQTNDAETGKLLQKKKIARGRNIRQYPVELIGATGRTAWVFAGEPMAFDAFTLEKKADMPILEEKNILLKGKFPAERRHYIFDEEEGLLFFTATDGRTWQLDPQSLQAKPGEPRPQQGAWEKEKERLEKEISETGTRLDSLYRQKSYRPAVDYQEGRIGQGEYRKGQQEYLEKRKVLFDLRDSLRNRLARGSRTAAEAGEREREWKQLRKENVGFTEMKVNQDTLEEKWLGLYADKEWEKMREDFRYEKLYGDASLRRLYRSRTTLKEEKWVVEKETAEVLHPELSWLNGGFLLDKNTGLPVRLHSPAGRLLVHKESIETKGSILVSRIGEDGEQIWMVNSGLTAWADWQLTGNKLLLLGSQHKELSQGENNVLLLVDLVNGQVSKYDYFSNKWIGYK